MIKEMVACRLHPDDKAALARYAKTQNVRQSDLIREAIAEKLVKLARANVPKKVTVTP